MGETKDPARCIADEIRGYAKSRGLTVSDQLVDVAFSALRKDVVAELRETGSLSETEEAES